jgi:hypothetical protein
MTHFNNDPSKPVHTKFEVIRAPDVGQQMETAELIAQDPIRDVALLRVQTPRSSSCLTLETTQIARGTFCGSLGFPLAQVVFTPAGKLFNLVERFQGAFISAFNPYTHPAGQIVNRYETDSIMYGGSSGCPGFLVDGHVVGMQSASVIEQPQARIAPKGSKKAKQQQRQIQASSHLSISIWVTSMDIIAFAHENGILN